MVLDFWLRRFVAYDLLVCNLVLGFPSGCFVCVIVCVNCNAA